MKKIAIIGYGYVGKAMADLFRDHYEVRVKEVNSYFEFRKEGTMAFEGNEEEAWKLINECDLGVICVPTEMKEDKQCDTSIVEECVEKLETPVILIKSTVPPGTTNMLIKKYKKRIVFSPEFSGESKYWSPYEFDKNMKACPWFIFGGGSIDTNYVLNIMAPILGPTKTYRQTDAKTAELVKYVENTFYALKVTFCNEMYEICEAMGINYWEMRELWLLDPRVNKMHTAVFKDNRGYGGKCFPKDVNGLAEASKRAGYDPQLLNQLIFSNDMFRRKNKED